jgi:hypothetical protein
LSAAQKIVDSVLDTPPDRTIELDDLMAKFRCSIGITVLEFRHQVRQGFERRVSENQGRLDETDITELPREDP